MGAFIISKLSSSLIATAVNNVPHMLNTTPHQLHCSKLKRSLFFGLRPLPSPFFFLFSLLETLLLFFYFFYITLAFVKPKGPRILFEKKNIFSFNSLFLFF